jgi:hypothetical protein
MHAQSYEAPWLIRLREVDPQAAAVFDEDPAKASKLDTLLANVGNIEDKLAIVRTALNAGSDPNDPAFVFAIQAIGIQKLISHDFADTIEQVRAASRAATESVESIIESTNAAVGAIQTAGDAAIAKIGEANTLNDTHLAALLAEIKKTTAAAVKKIESSGQTMQQTFVAQVDAIQTIGKSTQAAIEALPGVVEQIHASLDERAAKSLDTAIESTAKARVEDATVEALRDTNTLIQGFTEEAKVIHETMRPLRAQVERLAQGEKVLRVGRAFEKREYNAALIGCAFGVFVGLLIYGFVANALHLGIDPMLVSDAYAGRTYQAVWAGVSDSCRTEIKNLVQGFPSNVPPRTTHR